MSDFVFLRSDLSFPTSDDSLYQQLFALEGEVFREVKNRRTLRITLSGSRYFAKLHEGVGWGEIIKNLALLRLPVLGARREFDALEHLSGKGVRVPGVAACGVRGWNPARQQSFILLDAIEAATSLEDYTSDWALRAPVPAIKHRLIRAVAAMTRAMHSAGVNHRDLYICHFLLHHNPPDIRTPVLTLIDLHRAQMRHHVPRRWQTKDLGALLFSCEAIGLNRRDWFRFVREYSGSSLRQALATDPSFWLAVERRARRLSEKRRRHLEAGRVD